LRATQITRHFQEVSLKLIVWLRHTQHLQTVSCIYIEKRLFINCPCVTSPLLPSSLPSTYFETGKPIYDIVCPRTVAIFFSKWVPPTAEIIGHKM